MKPTIGAAVRRNTTVSAERRQIEALLAKTKPGELIEQRAIACALAITTRSAGMRLIAMRQEGVAASVTQGKTVIRWKLTDKGRRLLLGEAAWQAEQDAKPKAKKEKPEQGLAVAAPRAMPFQTAKPGTLSPWASGNPMRDGAQVAYGLRSLGIGA